MRGVECDEIVTVVAEKKVVSWAPNKIRLVCSPWSFLSRLVLCHEISGVVVCVSAPQVNLSLSHK
jgi:hypothetical protein